MITLLQLCHVSGQVVEDRPGVWAEISAKQSVRALVAIPMSIEAPEAPSASHSLQSALRCR
jgi:hypothetical protein